MIRFLLSALLLIGCANGERETYRFSFSGDPAARQAFSSALEEWNACGNVQGVLLNEGDDRGVEVLENEAEVPATALGITMFNGTYPKRIAYVKNPRLRDVFAHELGHAYRGSASHTNGGLMNPKLLDGEQHVDCEWIE